MKHASKAWVKRQKLKDLVILALLFILGIFIVLIFKPGYLANILIVYLPGMVYSLTRLKRSTKKILIFGIISILFIVPVEILARLTDSWDVASDFPRVLDIAPLENMLYGVVNIIYPLAFYEYFFDNDRNRKISPRYKYLIGIYIVLFITTFIVYFIDPALLKFDYWVLGLLILSPIFILLLIYKSHIVKRLILPAVFFGLMYLVHEAVSMYLGHWWWPGSYLLPITISDHIYPLEDLIIWIVFSNVAVISGYEVLWD